VEVKIKVRENKVFALRSHKQSAKIGNKRVQNHESTGHGMVFTN
jgi:hypothetical protein